MFSMSCPGAEALVKKFEAWGEQIKGLHTDVPAELQAWQTEDMRRHYPNMEVNDSAEELEASTLIWPRSRTSEEDEKRRRAGMGRNMGPRRFSPRGFSPRRFHAGRPPSSNRPILRDELFDKLDARMVELLAKAGKWP